eukprot:TRINITY_DN5431_c0_g1_i1.p1 TRINITY_DN5431_c0_g1~~TRINITY_DN5431_c0_g1_i1.p1  ORF type:complete len:110 (-),score=27.03 TRINITY_DN5431_c0_g1_i1:159-458(-)
MGKYGVLSSCFMGNICVVFSSHFARNRTAIQHIIIHLSTICHSNEVHPHIEQNINHTDQNINPTPNKIEDTIVVVIAEWTIHERKAVVSTQSTWVCLLL